MSEPIAWGRLRRLHPFDEGFGHGRGQPVDRHCIEGFLARHAGDVRGHMLEVGSSDDTRRFGGARVSRASVLHVAPDHGDADFVADLAAGDGLPADGLRARLPNW